MDKLVFDYFYKVNFNKNNFAVFYNEKVGLYLLQINNKGELIYPQFNDYIMYHDMHKNSSYQFVYNFSNFGTNNNSNSTDTLIHKKVRLIPKVIYKGTLMLLSTALLIASAGCKSTDATENEKINKNYADYSVETEYQHYDKDILYVHEDLSKNVIYCRDNDEFNSYTEIEIQPDYDDIREAFEANQNIPEQYKSIILNGLDRMEDEIPDLDLSVLYYNAQRMKFTELDSSDEMYQKTRSTSSACYLANTGEVFILKDEEKTKFTLCHEILGHGCTEAVVTSEDGKLVYYGFNVVIVPDVENQSETLQAGMIYAEGCADLIAQIASDEKQESTYNMGQEALRVIAELNDQTIGEVINSRGWNLYDKMYKSGNIGNPIEYVSYLDAVYQDWVCGNLVEGNRSLNEFFEVIVVDSLTEKMEKGIDVTKEASEIFDNSYFPDGIDLFYFENVEKTKRKTVERYDPKESKKIVLDRLEYLKNEQEIEQN